MPERQTRESNAPGVERVHRKRMPDSDNAAAGDENIRAPKAVR